MAGSDGDACRRRLPSCDGAGADGSQPPVRLDSTSPEAQRAERGDHERGASAAADVTEEFIPPKKMPTRNSKGDGEGQWKTRNSKGDGKGEGRARTSNGDGKGHWAKGKKATRR